MLEKFKNKWFFKWWGIVVIIIILIFISLSIYFFALLSKYKKAIETGGIITNTVLGQYSIYDGSKDIQEVSVSREELETIDDPFMGTTNPIMTIVEFGDFSCSYCLLMHKILRDFVMENSEKVKLIFRDFPLEDDYNRAMIANCAFEQNRFWQMHDNLFLNQGNFSEDLVDDFVKEAQLDEDKFNACRRDNKYKSEIEEDLILGMKAGVSGTPILFINGYKFAGVIPRTVLDQILAAAENENK